MLRKSFCRLVLPSRSYTQLKGADKVCAWQIHSYGDLEEVQHGTVRIPPIQDPDDILVKVEAFSVNPIDLYMIGGYGRTILKPIRGCKTMELPLALGRDFSGTILNKGHNVGNNLNIGDEVYGFIPLHKQGSFSEVVLTSKSHVLKKPKKLNHAESASLVYATMTAWSALYLFGGLFYKSANVLKVLVLGASGGVGTAAVQLLKSQGSVVFGACSSDAHPLLQSLGVDCLFDYKDPSYIDDVESQGYYHIILDCAKHGYENIPKQWKFGTYITLNSTLLSNTDKYGFFGGLLFSAGTLLQNNFRPPNQERSCIWGFFVPSGGGFQFIDNLIKREQIRPVIHKEFKFEQLPEALKALEQGHARGKIVVSNT